MGWLKPPSKNRHVAQVLTVEGEVRVKRGPIHAALRPGMSLKEDDHLVNDDRGHVHFEFTDGTQVKVGAGARWHLGNESHEHGRVFQIAAGTAWFAVQPQTHPMVVRTPNADVEILGTRLSVHVEGELTAVDLYEGQVLLHDETQRLELEAQQAVDISGAGWVPRAARALQDVVVEVVEVSQGGCRLKSFDASLDLGTFKVAFPSVVNTNVEARLMKEKLRIFSLEPGERGKVNLEWGPTWVMSDWNANEVGVQ
jgi:hypothetical protein